ncbi:MAG: hypothetical protein HY364_01585 [Candidatus Aenigmarchaeota archaeon]|nr:hypothetical protein [Candidatus Aenigmarchaeota archaeon]
MRNGRRVSSFNEYLEALPPKEAHMVAQYRKIAGVYNLLWHEITVRTYNSEWRKDGVGSCGIDKATSEDLLEGSCGSNIISLRERKNYETPGRSMACPYHRPDRGCILEELKSPRCLDHVDYRHDAEIKERFGIEVPEMRTALRIIQLGGRNPKEGDFELKPHLNDDFVEETYRQTMEIINHVRNFPVLHPEELLI